jgi:hypothetical protein
VRHWRATSPHRRWQLFKKGSPRTLEKSRDGCRVVSRKENVELVAFTGFFANDDGNPLGDEAAMLPNTPLSHDQAVASIERPVGVSMNETGESKESWSQLLKYIR